MFHSLSSRFWHSSEPQGENERKGKDRQIPGSCQRAEEADEHEGDGDTNCSWCPWNGPQEPGKETGWIGDQRKNRYHLDYITIKIS